MESPPWALQSGSYNAEQTRRAVFAWLARTGANAPGIVAGGLLSATDCQLSAPVSGMSVNVSTGELIMGGSEGGAQGAGYGRVTSQTNLSIAAANATNPRIDTVCATMSDAAYTEPVGGSGSQWALQVVTGTATAGATLVNLNGAATLPLSSLLLGYVLVPATATNIITADIANKATPASRASGSWTSLALVTNIGAFAGYYTPAYRYAGDRIELSGGVQNNTGGSTGAGNAFASNLPAPNGAVAFTVPVFTSGGTFVSDVACSISSGTNSLLVQSAVAAGNFFALDTCSYRIA